jgi:hypothetical protein
MKIVKIFACGAIATAMLYLSEETNCAFTHWGVGWGWGGGWGVICRRRLAGWGVGRPPQRECSRRRQKKWGVVVPPLRDLSSRRRFGGGVVVPPLQMLPPDLGVFSGGTPPRHFFVIY